MLRRLWNSRLGYSIALISKYSDIHSMQTSLLDLRSAIDEEDWETAARLCARALSLPTDMISSRFAGTVVVSRSQAFMVPYFS